MDEVQKKIAEYNGSQCGYVVKLPTSGPDPGGGLWGLQPPLLL